jgi:hypothetical protein
LNRQATKRGSTAQAQPGHFLYVLKVWTVTEATDVFKEVWCFQMNQPTRCSNFTGLYLVV